MARPDVDSEPPTDDNDAMQTAQKLLSRHTVHALQLELTRTKSASQTCAAIKMLEQFEALGFELRQVSHALADMPVPRGPWRSAPSPWERMLRFPSAAVRAAHAAGDGSLMRAAYERDFTTHSTNLVGKLDLSRRPVTPPPWPALDC